MGEKCEKCLRMFKDFLQKIERAWKFAERKEPHGVSFYIKESLKTVDEMERSRCIEPTVTTRLRERLNEVKFQAEKWNFRQVDTLATDYIEPLIDTDVIHSLARTCQIEY